MSHENKQRLLMLFQHHEDLQSCIHPIFEKLLPDKASVAKDLAIFAK